jgi:hypothetical protein
MKKPLFLAAMALLTACGGNAPAPSADSTNAKTDSSAMMRPIQSPYPIMYSSSFAMDEPKNAESVLAFWKAYDAGDFSSSKDFFADTFDVHLSSGFHMRTSRDSSIAGVKAHRSGFVSVASDVNAIMAVKSTDKNEHWVLIWGIEKDIPKKGKADSVFFQETWRFNAAGKADLMYSFAQQPQLPKK